MCSGIEYIGQLHIWKDHDVRLPVMMKDGTISWVKWGERYGVRSPFFQGPCARQESIKERKWDRYSPLPVKIPIDKYMERDSKGRPYWVVANEETFLQGLLATWATDQRVYVVTIEAPDQFRHIQTRWPRVITINNN